MNVLKLLIHVCNSLPFFSIGVQSSNLVDSTSLSSDTEEDQLMSGAAVVIIIIKNNNGMCITYSLESAYLLTYLLLCLRVISFCTPADIISILQIKKKTTLKLKTMQ